MPDLIRTPRRWLALAALAPLPLVWSAPSIAQAPAPAPGAAPTTAAERAQRDAERVFEFIKFHTLRPRMIEPSRAAKPAAPATPPAPTASPDRSGTPPRPGPTDVSPRPAPSLAASELPPTLEAAPVTAPTAVALPVAPATLPAAPPVPVLPPPTALPAPEADDGDDDALQLQDFVAPVLPPAVQATLGAGARNIKVRFTVEPDGRVSQAEAAAGVPRRLARPATDAILQWRFAPLPQPRTVEVEVAFRRD